jgi:hypothetical protein
VEVVDVVLVVVVDVVVVDVVVVVVVVVDAGTVVVVVVVAGTVVVVVDVVVVAGDVVVVVGLGAGLLVAPPSDAADATPVAVSVANTDTAMTNRRAPPLRDDAITDLPSLRPPCFDGVGRD